MSYAMMPSSEYVERVTSRCMFLLVDRPLDPGASVFINLVNAPHTYSLGMVLNVARCVRTYSGDYLIGGKFLRRLTPDELSPFVC